MIIATAGHVDHGKTALVAALTGVDTDRLPEEKRRKLTIDLGFAYLPVADQPTIGFIDVPGHERFVRNALCGLAGADFVLLVVAADDGPMPQTREHLAIIDLMGITNGAVALTKADRVSAERVAEVSAEIRALLAPTTLRDAPCLPVSAVSGAGIEALSKHLVTAASSIKPRPSTGNFRLAVDRAFDVVGAGFVVTGTVFSGSVSTGDQVRVAGQDATLRVRGIHAQNAETGSGHAGQRCALNLSGPDLRKSDIARGDWIVGGNTPAPVEKFDARIRVVADAARPLAHWTPVHVHLGAAETTGRVAVLEQSAIAPGADALVQISLDRPLGAMHGDRVILRDQSAQATLGGGRVIDIFPPRRGRAKPERILWLASIEEPAHRAALAAALKLATHGVDLDRFVANRNLTPAQLGTLENHVGMQIVAADQSRIGFAPSRWQDVIAAALARLEAWHRDHPGRSGLGESELFHGSGFRFAPALATAIAGELVRKGLIVRHAMGVALQDHVATMEPADARLWQTVKSALDAAGLRPATARELAETAGIPTRQMESFLVRAGRHGLVVRVSKTRFLTPEALLELAAMAEEIADATPDGMVSVTAFRDRSGIGRNMSIEILEFFDTRRFTQRHGDVRTILQPADKLFAKR